MAFPWVAETLFEPGTTAHFDAQSPDPFTRAAIRHYTDLAAIPRLPAPYRGAYAFHIDLSTNTTDHYLQETGSWDTAAAARLRVRFMFYLGGPTVTMANNDLFSIFQAWSATNTVEAAVFVQYTTANGYRLGINETASATGASFLDFALDKWHSVEVNLLVDAGAGNNGTIDAFLDGSAFTQVASLDQGTFTSGVIGVLGQDAGTTQGHVLFDWVLTDDTRMFHPTIRFPHTLHMTASQHAFMGQGEITGLTLRDGGSGDVTVDVYDTDRGNTDDVHRKVAEMRVTVANSIFQHEGPPILVRRGAYVSLGGTDPRCDVTIGHAQGYWSDGRIRQHAMTRGAGV